MAVISAARGMDMDDPRRPRMFPNRRIVLDRIIADRDNDVGTGQEFVTWSVVQLSDPAGESLEQI